MNLNGRAQRLNVSMVKGQSRKLVFRQIRLHQGITRPEIVRATELSQGTVKTVVEEFVEAGIVEEVKNNSTAVGRKPQMIVLRPAALKLVVLDLSSRQFNGQVLDLSLETDRQIEPPPPAGGPYWQRLEQFLDTVADELDKEEPGRVLGVGVAVPGPYLAHEDRVICNIVPELQSLRLADTIRTHLPFPLVIGEDVQLAALAEVRRDEGTQQPLFFLYVGEGIGGACVSDGYLFTGANNFAGEIGQMVLEEGHLEDMIGWPAFLRDLGYPEDVPLFEVREDLLRRRAAGDRRVTGALHRITSLLARGLSYAVCLLNPRTIAISGRYNFLGREFFADLDRRLRDLLIQEHSRNLTLRPARVDDRGMIIGAASHIIDQWLDRWANNVEAEGG